MIWNWIEFELPSWILIKIEVWRKARLEFEIRFRKKNGEISCEKRKENWTKLKSEANKIKKTDCIYVDFSTLCQLTNKINTLHKPL